VWFNTSSIDEADDEWMENDTTPYTIEEINDISKHHTVTHVILKNDIPPNINTLFPHLTELSVFGVDSNVDWTRYYIVSNTFSISSKYLPIHCTSRLFLNIR